MTIKSAPSPIGSVSLAWRDPPGAHFGLIGHPTSFALQLAIHRCCRRSRLLGILMTTPITRVPSRTPAQVRIPPRLGTCAFARHATEVGSDSADVRTNGSGGREWHRTVCSLPNGQDTDRRPLSCANAVRILARSGPPGRTSSDDTLQRLAWSYVWADLLTRGS